MKRKILSLILVFAMTVSLLTVGTGAVEPTYGDTAGHWAESSIERWSEYGIIQGSNGQFDPNGQLTCAQLATILAKLLKLPAAKDAGFTDNTADAWYYDAINRCAAAGILNGNGDGTVTPEAPITRERAMVMLARALGIEPIRKPDLTKYTDAAQVSAYAQGYVAAMIEAGIVGGVTADELAPQANINRASTVTILDRAISTYADKAGATVKADGKGIVLVVAENVKITGAPEGTKIVVADGATGLTVNGKSVSDDQTYIVPKAEPAKPSGGSSSGGSYTPPHSHSYNETTHKCSCGEVDPAYAVASVSGKNYLTLSEAITAAQAGNKTMTLAADKTTTVSIQEILDGQHGSIDGLTIELPSGDYSALEFGRATKYPGSNTKYHTFKGGYDARTETTEYTTAEELKTTLADTNTYHGNLMYIRSLNNITLKAATGANVNIAGVSMESAHVYGTGDKTVHDYVLNNDIVDTNKSFWLVHHVNDIKFEGLNFTGNVNIASSLADALIDGVTFDNCSFTTNGTESDKGQALRYYNENNNGKVSDLKVINCTFTNCRQGVYTGHIKNVTVTGSSFTNTGHNAIAIQDHRGACDHGVVQITGNTFTDIHNRIIRFNSVGADTSITITYNTATNSGDESDEVIEITSLAQGATCDIHDNSWGDGKKVNIPDSRVEMQAQIGEAQYATLAAALAAAKSGDTVKLVSNITTNTTIEVTGDKAITIDFGTYTLTGTSGVQVLRVGGTANVTLTATTGGINGGSGGDNVAIIAKENATINITSGNYTVGGDANNIGNSTVYVVGNGKVNISGGTFSSEKTYQNKYYVLNLNNSATGSISVTGGTFVGQNPGVGDDNKGGTFLAPDYKSVETPTGVWTVSKMTWDEYPADASVVPSGLVITEYPQNAFDSSNGKTGTITIKDKDALLYFAYRLDLAKAYAECGEKTHGTGWGHTCIWYGGAYARHIVLDADIDLGGMTRENGFGNMKDFTFNGQNHKISNVTINYTGTGNTGLFVGGNRGISNLVVENVKVNAPNGTENAVGIVSSDANALITNVTVRNSSVTGGKYTGAIVGYNYGSVTNCKVENCTVSGRYKVGGIIGYICNSNDVPTYVTGNDLTGVTVKGENLVADKTHFVIGKIVGNWNATVGECSSNKFSGTTDATCDIGEIESRCTNVIVNGVTQLPQNATPETINNVITNSKDAEGNVVKNVTLALPSKSTFELNNGLVNESNNNGKGRNVTFVGDGTQTVDVITKAVSAENGQLNYQRGSTFTFENVTVQAGEGDFDGIVCDELTYKDCTIKGKLTLFGKATFTNCVFDNTMANQYSIWTWGGTDVTFKGCTFNTNGKAILLYGGADGKNPTNLVVNKCTFNDRNNGAAGKAAIEIGNDYNATYSLTVTNATVNGFADGKNTGSKLWANKNSMDAAHLSVTIDGTQVLL